MNAYTLMIEAADRPAMMERLMRTTRHRGFAIRDLHLKAEDGTDSVTISLTVTGERPLHLLTSQLMKLVDVASLNVKQPLSQPLTITA